MPCLMDSEESTTRGKPRVFGTFGQKHNPT